MEISFVAKPPAHTDLYLFAVSQGQTNKIKGPHADAAKALLAANPQFKGMAGEVLTTVIPGFKHKRLGVLGLGSDKGRNLLSQEHIGGKLVGALTGNAAKNIFIDTTYAGRLNPRDVAAMASGAMLRAYEFRAYKTKNKDQILPDSLAFMGGAAIQKAYGSMAKTARAVHWARDLVNEPPNVLYPESFAKRVTAALKPLGVKVTLFDSASLERKGFEAFYSVGKASDHPPCMLVLEYKNHKNKKGRPIALVGKGITFDTGGYSIKPNEGMLDMKCDMAGAAAVAGAFMALASNKARVHVVGALALAENMISDEGYKPCDILKSLSGQTIEVTNTDAEGRLVLCDTMWHIQETYKPRVLVDIATLTGAALVALGEEYAAVFANDDRVHADLKKASEDSGDKIWAMPLDPAYGRAMESPVADMKNAAATRYGGSCTAAAFLQRFIHDDVLWAHIDMAPTMTLKSDTALCPKGATGFGVRLLSQYVSDAHE